MSTVVESHDHGHTDLLRVCLDGFSQQTTGT